MRLQRTIAAGLLAICCADGVVGRKVLIRRQDTTDDSSPSTTDAAAATTSFSDSPYSTAQSSEALSSSYAATTGSDTNNDDNQSSTPSTTFSSVQNAATSAITMSGSQTSMAASQETEGQPGKNHLPIEPTITPALGIAGAVLMCTGVALALVGIKHNWLHVFLSTAFLAALSITVLVIYVMNPPVSDAVQGAYFVAAILTGLILGALSLVFKEITEGLGCLLGGFCLAMWFLVLRPGGLVRSTSGRAVLIAVFSLVGLALSFSRYTRNYGLILCTSFAGAMATIIGIDCFSRAGLKEFWLYLWNLNDDIFPIGTNTYPITKGIRVEIAGVIVIFLFGVMSQFKIWKVVKERRQRQDAERLRDDESRDQLESRVGREIEQANNRDREEWEAVYGDKERKRANTDSGVGSSVDSFQKGTASVQERELGAVELLEMPSGDSKRGSKTGKRGTVTVRVASEDDYHPEQNHSEENLLDTAHPNRSTSQMSRSRTSLNEKASRTSLTDQTDAYNADFQTRSTTPGPQVVPLPFSPPIEEEEEDDNRSLSSQGTAGQSVHPRRGFKLNKLALKRKDEQDRGSTIIPRIEDDRASSIAATAADNDGASRRHLSQRLSVFTLNFRNPSRESLMVQSTDGKSRPTSLSAKSMGERPVDEDDEEALTKPSEHAQDQASESSKSSKREKRRRRSRDRSSDAGKGDAAAALATLTGHLPEKLSKIAMAYRTNEWAKHIADADTPDNPDDGADAGPPSPGVHIDTEFAKEAAKPVDVKELQTSVMAEQQNPKPEVKPEPKPEPQPEPQIEASAKPEASKTASNNPFKRSSSSNNLVSRNSSGNGKTPVYAVQRSESQMSMRRQTSSASMTAPQNLARVASVPLISQPLVESPVEERVASPGPYLRNTMSPVMGSSGNLMDQRNTMLRHKPTTQSFMGPSASTGNLINVIAPSDSASSRNVPINDGPDGEEVSSPIAYDEIDEEDMTLAQRKELMALQRGQTPSPALIRSESRNANFSRRPSYPLPGQLSRQNSVQANNAALYDSHQPKRSNTVDYIKQNAMMSQWRSSLQQETSVKHPAIAEESARQHLLSERRQVEWQQQKQAAERMQRESVMDIAMRTGQLHGAHQDAMRRMQAKANRNG